MSRPPEANLGAWAKRVVTDRLTGHISLAEPGADFYVVVKVPPGAVAASLMAWSITSAAAGGKVRAQRPWQLHRPPLALLTCQLTAIPLSGVQTVASSEVFTERTRFWGSLGSGYNPYPGAHPICRLTPPLQPFESKVADRTRCAPHRSGPSRRWGVLVRLPLVCANSGGDGVADDDHSRHRPVCGHVRRRGTNLRGVSRRDQQGPLPPRAAVAAAFLRLPEPCDGHLLGLCSLVPDHLRRLYPEGARPRGEGINACNFVCQAAIAAGSRAQLPPSAQSQDPYSSWSFAALSVLGAGGQAANMSGFIANRAVTEAS